MYINCICMYETEREILNVCEWNVSVSKEQLSDGPDQ